MRYAFVTANIGTLALVVLGSMPRASAQGLLATPKTVWEGTYASAQANRGQEIYSKSCATCHQDDLSGGGDEAAAALRGPDFLAQWNNKTVADLFRAISEGMPKDAPGSLSSSDSSDLVSFLFKKNQIPAADTELPSDPTKLRQILITDKPR